MGNLSPENLIVAGRGELQLIDCSVCLRGFRAYDSAKLYVYEWLGSRSLPRTEWYEYLESLLGILTSDASQGSLLPSQLRKTLLRHVMSWLYRNDSSALGLADLAEIVAHTRLEK